MERVAQNYDQTATLGAIRDTLLRKPLSGEVRVQEAERLIKVAT